MSWAAGCMADPAAGLEHAGDEAPFPLPVYRLGPRVGTAGGFSIPITGTLRVPTDTFGFVDFSSVVIAAATQPDAVIDGLSGTTVEGDSFMATFSGMGTFASSAPVADREIVLANLPGKDMILLAVPADGGVLAFSPLSTALQALVLAHVPDGLVFTIEDATAFGVAPGDHPRLDAAMAGVASVISAQLASTGGTGLDRRGMPILGTPVHEAINAVVATGDLATPTLEGPFARNRLGIVGNLVDGAVAVLWSRHSGPSVPLSAQPRSSAVSFFPLDDWWAPGMLVSARQSSGGGLDASQSLASTGQVYLPALSDAPLAPALDVVSTADPLLRASGVSSGNWVVVFASATTRSVGFMAIRAPAGSDAVTASLAGISPLAGGYFVVQIDERLAVSEPSNIVYF